MLIKAGHETLIRVIFFKTPLGNWINDTKNKTQSKKLSPDWEESSVGKVLTAEI